MGWKQDEACGKKIDSVFNIVHELTRMPYKNPVQKVLSTRNVIELANHTLLISRNGTERVIADSESPIKDKYGETIGVNLVFRDMAEKQRFHEITLNTQKLESLGILAGGIAHDFNNLSGGVFGYIDLATPKPDRPGYRQSYHQCPAGHANGWIKRIIRSKYFYCRKKTPDTAKLKICQTNDKRLRHGYSQRIIDQNF